MFWFYLNKFSTIKIFKRPVVAGAVLQTASPLLNSLTDPLMVCENIFTAPPHPKGSWRAPKSHYWFKCYGNFAKWVDFACCWSFSGDDLLSRGPIPSSLNIIYQFCAILTELVPFKLAIYFKTIYSSVLMVFFILLKELQCFLVHRIWK